jgi:N6-adenosine-specific RNA methylase IME4
MFDSEAMATYGGHRLMYEFHPIANIFPLLEADDLKTLASDITANGQREPIIIFESKILDGRNRYRACEIAGVEPLCHPYMGDKPLADVLSWNLHRRHLTTSQRSMVGARIAKLQLGDNQHTENSAPSQEVVADNLKVSADSIQFAKKVEEKGAQELIHAVDAGNMSVSLAAQLAEIPKEKQIEILSKPEFLEAAKAVIMQHREEKAAAKREQNKIIKALKPSLPEGKFETIVIDPPWDMEKIERDCRPNQVDFDYPTMAEEQLREFGATIDQMAAEDCHLFMWTTQKFTPMAFRLLDAWGFRYVFHMVWHKNGGPQPFGLPQYNHETVLYGRRGTPTFPVTTAFPTCFNAPRREHSRKPDEFYDIIRHVTDGPRIDVFNRGAIEGFASYGNETEKFAA